MSAHPVVEQWDSPCLELAYISFVMVQCQGYLFLEGTRYFFSEPTKAASGETQNNIDTSGNIPLEMLKVRILFEKRSKRPGEKPIESQATETQDRKETAKKEELPCDDPTGRINKRRQLQQTHQWSPLADKRELVRM